MFNNKRSLQLKTQTGIGFIGLFGGAFLAIFFAIMGVSLLPLYLENFSVQSCVSSLVENEEILNQSETNIKSALMKKLSVSNVKSVKRENISINKGKETVIINIDYSVQANFIKNVDFLVHFDERKKVNL